MRPCMPRGGTKDGLVGFELEGKKFGVVGTGAIGLRVARIAQAFGCEVLAYSRTVRDVEGVRFVDLKTLLSECDIVSLHTPLNDGTRGLMNRESIGWMKKNAVLINTARGPVVDSDALAEALTEGRIGEPVLMCLKRNLRWKRVIRCFPPPTSSSHLTWHLPQRKRW